MESVCQLGEKVRDRLKFLLEVCTRQRSGICQVLGLWMNLDEEASALFLVCEMFNQTLASVLNDEGAWGLGMETIEKFDFGMVGMELCEVVMRFHSEGVVFGCLGVDCFSFDAYGHCLLNLNNVLVKAKRLLRGIEDDKPDSKKTLELLSPEVFIALHEGSFSLDQGSDVWSLGCILVMILAGGGEFTMELLEDFHCLLMKGDRRNLADVCLSQYDVWREKVICKLDSALMGMKFQPLFQMLSSCLQYNLESRPQVRHLWCCIRSHFIKIPAEIVVASDESEEKKSKENLVSCLFIGNTGRAPSEAGGVSQQQGTSSPSENVPEVGWAGSCETNMDQLKQELVDGEFAKCQQGGGFQFDTLQAHQDCVTGLAVGGGYLFSSSFDKTVGVWSLQDFSHVRSLKGHEHRVMAMVVMDETQPLCISGDSGSGIFVWRIDTPLGQELQQKWYEHNDWRYSGIHSMAISEGYLYSGSGDKSIKAWSLQDYSLACTMTGHNSTVSSLVVANGVLYSGSWDGTIRLWCLSDHSLLSVLEDDSAGSFVPILSLCVDRQFLVSAYENGSIKIWKDDAFVRSGKIQDGAIFAVHMDKKWLFTGGWSKSINIQELSENELQMDISPTASITCDSIITSLFSWRGMLFVGFSNKEIKVYYYATK